MWKFLEGRSPGEVPVVGLYEGIRFVVEFLGGFSLSGSGHYCLDLVLYSFAGQMCLGR